MGKSFSLRYMAWILQSAEPATFQAKPHFSMLYVILALSYVTWYIARASSKMSSVFLTVCSNSTAPYSNCIATNQLNICQWQSLKVDMKEKLTILYFFITSLQEVILSSQSKFMARVISFLYSSYLPLHNVMHLWGISTSKQGSLEISTHNKEATQSSLNCYNFQSNHQIFIYAIGKHKLKHYAAMGLRWKHQPRSYACKRGALTCYTQIFIWIWVDMIINLTQNRSWMIAAGVPFFHIVGELVCLQIMRDANLSCQNNMHVLETLPSGWKEGWWLVKLFWFNISTLRYHNRKVREIDK